MLPSPLSLTFQHFVNKEHTTVDSFSTPAQNVLLCRPTSSFRSPWSLFICLDLAKCGSVQQHVQAQENKPDSPFDTSFDRKVEWAKAGLLPRESWM